MSATPLQYRLEGASWILQFAPAVLHAFTQHAQTRGFQRESVGQLYARDLTGCCVDIEQATLLKPKWSLRARVKFDTAQAMVEREQMFKQGWHCVGLWHTHPEAVPEPSREDRDLARQHALAARPQLSGLVFVIVGTISIPIGLGVWIDDGALLRCCALDERVPMLP